MQHNVLKGKELVHFGFCDGDYSNNLHIRDATIIEDPAFRAFSVDVSGNLRVKNKQTNSYADAMDFKSETGKFKVLQISHELIIKRFKVHANNWPNGPWRLNVIFGSEHNVSYPVRFNCDDLDLWFEVADSQL